MPAMVSLNLVPIAILVLVLIKLLGIKELVAVGRDLT
jgi:hypothetical protein